MNPDASISSRRGTLDSPDVRCECGRLLGIKMSEGYEIKCTRCKQKKILPCECVQGRSQ